MVLGTVEQPSPRQLAVKTLAPESAAPAETTLVVVAERALIRAGLRSLLGEHPGLSVIGEAETIADAARAAADLRPDVVLFDEPPLGDENSLARLRSSVAPACVVCLGRGSTEAEADVFCVPSDAGVLELCSVLGVALSGRCAGCAFRGDCPAPRVAVALSRRERQVAVRVAEGLSSKQIAAHLGIALRTVNTYRESLARKLGASSAAVVTRFVLENGLSTSIDDAAL